MAEAWAVNADAGAPEYSAVELRRITAMHLHPGVSDRMGARQGVRPHSSAVVTVSGTTWTQHDVTAVVYPGLTSASGPYVVEKVEESGALNPADGGNPRLDALDLQVRDDDEDASGFRDVRVVYAPGTPASSPTAPAATANSLRLATILVPAGGSPSPSVSTLAQLTVAAGGILPVRTTAEGPATAYEGMYRDRADTDVLERYNGSTWQAVASPTGVTQFAYKPSSQTITSSTTLQDDNDLVLPVEANAVYQVESTLIIGGSSSGDVKLQWSAPAGALFNIAGHGLNGSAAGSEDQVVFFVDEASGTTLLGTIGTGGNSRPAFFSGVISVGGTAGNFLLRWAQNTSNATGTTIRVRSFLKLVRVG